MSAVMNAVLNDFMLFVAFVSYVLGTSVFTIAMLKLAEGWISLAKLLAQSVFANLLGSLWIYLLTGGLANPQSDPYEGATFIAGLAVGYSIVVLYFLVQFILKHYGFVSWSTKRPGLGCKD